MKKFLSVILLWSSLATASKPVLMAALGDSLTAATLANLPLQRHLPYPTPIALRSMYLINPIKEWLDQQYSDGVIVANKKSLSWASGGDIPSHFQLLKNHLFATEKDFQLEVLNFAFPRDTTGDLENQAEQLVHAMSSGNYSSLKYVTLMIGSNDSCSQDTPKGIPPETMAKNLMRAFQKLSQIQQKEPIRILMVGIPKITDLGSHKIRSTPHPLGGDCDEIRNRVLHFCDSLLTWKSSEEREEKEALIREKNFILEQTAHQASLRFKNLQIHFTHQLETIAIHPELLALDCFHLEEKGQTLLSAELWKAQPWFTQKNSEQ